MTQSPARRFITEAALADVAVELNPEQYRAPGGSDLQAVRNCFDAATALVRSGLVSTIKQPGVTVVLTGTYNLTGLAAPIDVLCNVDGASAAFLIPDAYAGTAVRVGHTTSGSYLQNAQVSLPDVVKSSSASIVTGSVGVRVMNIGNSHITLGRTAFFETGAWFGGLGQGCAYNTIDIGWISYSKVSLKLVPGSGGWVNQNVFVAGGIQQSPGAFGGGLRRSGWKHLLIDGTGTNAVNGNTFVGVSFEGDVSEFVFDIANAYDNLWLGARFEQGTALASATASAASSTLTAAAHGLAVGDMVRFVASTAPGGMVADVPYYVTSTPDANSFTVSQKKSGTPVTFTSTGASVTFGRPHRVRYNPTVVCYNNVIRDPFLVHGFLDVVNVTTTGGGNGVETPSLRTAEAYAPDGRPTFRARNTSSITTARPLYAGYPSTANPLEDPHGWTAALSDQGLLLAAGGAELGRLNSVGGVLKWKRPADSAAFDVPTVVRNQAGAIAIAGLSCPANTTTTTTITLAGASASDHVTVTMLSHVTGIVFSHAFVSAANTVTLVFGNITGSTIVMSTTVEAMVTRRYF